MKTDLFLAKAKSTEKCTEAINILFTYNMYTCSLVHSQKYYDKHMKHCCCNSDI